MNPATTLDGLIRNLHPRPLRPDQLEELFVETADARDPGYSRREMIAEILTSDSPSAKVLLAGHGGTGKSTEIVKFCSEHQDRFNFVQMSIVADGDLAKVNVEGLLVLIAEAVLRQLKERGIELDPDHLETIYSWFDKTFTTRDETTVLKAQVGGGVDTKGSIMADLLGLTATLKADIQQGSTKVSKTVREDESRLPDLAAHCGHLLKEAEIAVFERETKHLVVIVEDLDKIDVGVADRLFIHNPAPLAGLPVKAVFTAPIFLFCNPRSVILDSLFDKVTMPMIKVADQEGQRYAPGWETIREILAHRFDIAACIDEDALTLAVSQTGGVLRHLFETLRTAARAAGYAVKRDAVT